MQEAGSLLEWRSREWLLEVLSHCRFCCKEEGDEDGGAAVEENAEEETTAAERKRDELHCCCWRERSFWLSPILHVMRMECYYVIGERLNCCREEKLLGKEMQLLVCGEELLRGKGEIFNREERVYDDADSAELEKRCCSIIGWKMEAKRRPPAAHVRARRSCHCGEDMQQER